MSTRSAARRAGPPASTSSTGCSAAGWSPGRSPCSAASRASARARCCSRRSRSHGRRRRALSARHRRGVAEQVRAARRAARRAPPTTCCSSPRRRCPHVLAHVDAVAPDVLAVDSIQTVADPELAGAPGSVTQVRECAHRLVQLAKDRNLADAARRPRHQGRRARRPARARAHRRHRALVRGRPPPRAAAAARAQAPVRPHARARAVRDGRSAASPTSPTRRRSSSPTGARACPARWSTAVLEGARPLLVEVQALVAPTPAPVPRRSAPGPRREPAGAAARGARRARRASTVADADVYASVAGGVRVTEPGADLAVALAVASAGAGPPVPQTTSSRSARSASAARCARSARRRVASPRRRASGSPRARRAPSTPTSPGSTCAGPDARPRARDGPGARRPRRLETAQRGAGPASRPRPLAPAYRGGSSSYPRAASRSSLRPDPAEQEDRRPVPAPPRSEAMLAALRLVAPGTPLREGLDRILQARMGALIVVGDGPDVLGALLRRVPARRRVHAPAPLGAGEDGRRDHPRRRTRHRVARANVHLVPDPEHPHLGDRHPAPHRRAGRPPDRRRR